MGVSTRKKNTQKSNLFQRFIILWSNGLNAINNIVISITDSIKLIALPTASEANQNFVGVTGTISGFGKTSNGKSYYFFLLPSLYYSKHYMGPESTLSGYSYI